jgi:hypothetical protein
LPYLALVEGGTGLSSAEVTHIRPIDKKQIILIHLAKTQLGIAEDAYRYMLEYRYQVQTSKNLSYSQADDFITYFKRLGFRVKAKKPACSLCRPRIKREQIPDNVMYMVSPQQLNMIEHLKQDIKWRTWDGYHRWLQKYFGLTVIRLSVEASAVIEGLKGIWRSQNKCECPYNVQTRGANKNEVINQ